MLNYLKTLSIGVSLALAPVAASAAVTTPGLYTIDDHLGGNHGTWLRDFVVGPGGLDNYWSVDSGTFDLTATTGTLNATFTNSKYTDLTGTLMLDLVRVGTPGNPGAPTLPKCEYGACPADVADWIYFDFDPTGNAKFVVDGDTDVTVSLTQKPADLKYRPQLGIGANSKDATVLGFATWMSWTSDATSIVVDSTTYSLNGSGTHGDINITLEPVPLPAAGWLLLAGLGAMGAMRRRAS